MKQLNAKEAIQLAQRLIREQLAVLTALTPLATDQTHARVLASNALLAAGVFLQNYSMSTLRTSEIQFLGHVRNAILNGGRFTLEPGEMPLASFAGKVIDSRINDTAVFADGSQGGLLVPADAIALLSWLQSYLHQTQELVTGGDAG